MISGLVRQVARVLRELNWGLVFAAVFCGAFWGGVFALVRAWWLS